MKSMQHRGRWQPRGSTQLFFVRGGFFFKAVEEIGKAFVDVDSLIVATARAWDYTLVSDDVDEIRCAAAQVPPIPLENWYEREERWFNVSCINRQSGLVGPDLDVSSSRLHGASSSCGRRRASRLR